MEIRGSIVQLIISRRISLVDHKRFNEFNMIYSFLSQKFRFIFAFPKFLAHRGNFSYSYKFLPACKALISFGMIPVKIKASI